MPPTLETDAVVRERHFRHCHLEASATLPLVIRSRLHVVVPSVIAAHMLNRVDGPGAHLAAKRAVGAERLADNGCLRTTNVVTVVTGRRAFVGPRHEVPDDVRDILATGTSVTDPAHQLAVAVG